MIDSPYTDPDLIRGLYEDPANEILLAEYILQTGGVAAAPNLAGGGRQGGSGGSVIGGIDVGIGTGGDGGDGPFRDCFTGENSVPMFNGESFTFEHLWEHREEFLGKGAKSFTEDNRIMPGKILDIKRRLVHELLYVNFEGEKEPQRLVETHRFWTQWLDFKPMHSLTRQTKVFIHPDNEWELTSIEKKEPIAFREGIYVYNLSIARYQDYFCFQPGGFEKAVSNAKPFNNFG